MPDMVFHIPINNARAILTQTHNIADGQFVVDNGAIFSSPSPSAPVKVSTTVGGINAHFSITGRTGNTLIIGGVLEGTADLQVPVGTAIEVRITAKDLSDVQQVLTTGLAASARRPTNAQTSTTYTLTVDDEGKLITLDNVSAVTLIIPPHSSVNLPLDTEIDVLQMGNGQVTISPASGVSTLSYQHNLSLAGAGAGGNLKQIMLNYWAVTGLLVPTTSTPTPAPNVVMQGYDGAGSLIVQGYTGGVITPPPSPTPNIIMQGYGTAGGPIVQGYI